MKLLPTILSFLLLALFVVQVRAADRTVLKTGVQTLPSPLPDMGEKGSALESNLDLSREVLRCCAKKLLGDSIVWPSCLYQSL